MSKSNLVEIEVKIIHQTEKAWLLQSGDTGVQDWFPKSWGEIETNGRSAVLTTKQDKAEEKRFV